MSSVASASSRTRRSRPPTTRERYPWRIDSEGFESLLEQVRDLHRRADEITREGHRLHENVRARLSWDRDVPTLPEEQQKLADEVVEALSTKLSPSQSRLLHRVFFGR